VAEVPDRRRKQCPGGPRGRRGPGRGGEDARQPSPREAGAAQPGPIGATGTGVGDPASFPIGGPDLL